MSALERRVQRVLRSRDTNALANITERALKSPIMRGPILHYVRSSLPTYVGQYGPSCIEISINSWAI